MRRLQRAVGPDPGVTVPGHAVQRHRCDRPPAAGGDDHHSVTRVHGHVVGLAAVRPQEHQIAGAQVSLRDRDAHLPQHGGGGPARQRVSGGRVGVVDEAGAVEAALGAALAAPHVRPADLLGGGAHDVGANAPSQLRQVGRVVHRHAMVVMVALLGLRLVVGVLLLVVLVVVPGGRGRSGRRARVGRCRRRRCRRWSAAVGGAAAGGWRRRRRREGHAAEIDEGAGRDAVVIGGDIDLDAGHAVVVERGGDGQRAPVTECQRLVAGLRCGHGRSVDHQISQPQVDGWSLAGGGLRDQDVQAAQRQLTSEEGGAFHEDLAGCSRIVRRDGAPRVRHLHGGCVGGGLPDGRPGRGISRQLGRGRNRDRAVGGYDQHALG